MAKKKTPKLKTEFDLGFINEDVWEVEHETDKDIQILSMGHNRRLATIQTEGLLLETSLANAELIGEAPTMLRLLVSLKTALDKKEKISYYDNATLKRILGKFYTL